MLDAILQSAQELAEGPCTPSLKLALYAAAMSPLQQLSKNGLQTRILARYVSICLPEREQLFEELKQAKGNINNNHIKALYRIEALEQTGILAHLTDIGSTYTEQCAWREKLMTLLTGYGIGRKAISFAALIYAPMTCELVPVDRHVLKRLGYTFDSVQPKQKNLYLAIEARIANERAQAGCYGIALGLWHWYKWQEWRVQEGDSLSSGVESHQLLSCRSY